MWLLAPSFVQASPPYSEDAVKAAFLYRFAGYVDWPASAMTGPPFTIAVLGADGVAEKLRQLLPNQTVKTWPAQVRRIGSIRDLGPAHVLYIGRGHAGNLDAVLTAVGNRPVLVVTDHDRGLELGGAVNFLRVDRRVRFEVSLPAAERAGLKVSPELLFVAVRVKRGRPRATVSRSGKGEPRLAPRFSYRGLA